jgi:DNA helicase-2/ATP-dependent DNA helicase PcrA
VQQQARKGDRHLYAARTRFIPADLTGHFERRSWPAPRLSVSLRQNTVAPVDLQERLRGMWRRTGS